MRLRRQQRLARVQAGRWQGFPYLVAVTSACMLALISAVAVAGQGGYADFTLDTTQVAPGGVLQVHVSTPSPCESLLPDSSVLVDGGFVDLQAMVEPNCDMTFGALERTYSVGPLPPGRYTMRLSLCTVPGGDLNELACWPSGVPKQFAVEGTVPHQIPAGWPGGWLLLSVGVLLFAWARCAR